MIEEEKLQTTLDKFTAASDELLFPSESDEPFEAFSWNLPTKEALNNAQILEYLQIPADTQITQKTLDNFFRVVTTPQEWHSDEDLDIVEKFQELAFTMRKNLNKIQVFLVGNIEIDAYIVGITIDKLHWAGLKTKVIET